MFSLYNKAIQTQEVSNTNIKNLPTNNKISNNIKVKKYNYIFDIIYSMS